MHAVSVMSFLLASEAAAFGINTNLLETNIINIAIVLALLIYAGRGFLGGVLSQRRQAIESAIVDTERRSQEAAEKLAEQQQKLAQAQAESARLIAQAKDDAAGVREAILAGVDEDIARLREAAEREIDSERDRILLQLRQQVAEKTLARVMAYFEGGLSDSVQEELIDRSIDLLGAKS